jgi:hypothetical protein
MNANELRIGNYILKNGSNYIVGTLFFVDVYDGTAMGFDLQPIPLTEEWLLRFGFEKDDVFDKIFTYLPLHDLCMDKLSFRKSEGFICYDGIKYRTLLKHIQYVHQLQNLYFALTSEELTLKTEL